MKSQIVDGVHGVLYTKHNPDALLRGFSLFISDGALSRYARTAASSGRLLARNMLASECVTGYARILENVLNFPSDTLLPHPVSHLQRISWEWRFFPMEQGVGASDMLTMDESVSSHKNSSVIYTLEEQTDSADLVKTSEDEQSIVAEDFPTELDWDVLRDMESSEETEQLEMEEVWSLSATLVLGYPPHYWLCPSPLFPGFPVL